MHVIQMHSLLKQSSSGTVLQDAVLSQGGPRDADVNFGRYRSLQRHSAVFTAIATLSN